MQPLRIQEIFNAARMTGFRRKITLWLVTLNILLWLLALYSIYHDKQEQERRMQIDVQNISQLLAYDVNALFSRIDLMMLSVIHEAERQLKHGGIQAAGMNAFLRRHQSFLSEIRTLGMTDVHGGLRFGTGIPGIRQSSAERAGYLRAKEQKEGRLVISPPVMDAASKQWFIPVAKRYHHADGQFGGVVFASLPVEYLVQKFSRLNLGKRGVVTLRSDENLSYARYPWLEGDKALGQVVLSDRLRELLKENPVEATYIAPSPSDRIVRLYSYRRLADYPMNVLAGLELDDALSEWWQDSAKTFMMALLTSVVSLIFGLMLSAAWRKQQVVHEALRESEQRWSLALESGNFAVWDWDMTAGKVELSKLGKRMFGFEEEEIGDNMSEWEALTHPNDLPHIIQRMKDHFRHRAGFFVAEYRVRCKDETWKWIYSRGLVVKRAADGKPMRMIGIHADITQRKYLEKEMQLANTAYSMANEAMLVTDENNRIVSVNAAFTRITGYSFQDVQGRNPSLLSARQHNRDFYQKMWGALLLDGCWSGEVVNRRKNGEIYYEWLSIKRIHDEQGRVSNHVAVFSDITARKRVDEHIRRLALHDMLTGLPNRVLMSERLEQAIVRARRDKSKFALLYFDLDKFKPVNDMHGHEVGDWLLIQVAERVLAIVRESDTVVRLGGDEFVVLLAGVERPEDAVKVGEKILKALTRPFDFAQIKLEISTSVGVALYPEHGTDEKTLTRHADVAMYQSKRNGRSQVTLYSPDMGQAAA